MDPDVRNHKKQKTLLSRWELLNHVEFTNFLGFSDFLRLREICRETRCLTRLNSCFQLVLGRIPLTHWVNIFGNTKRSHFPWLSIAYGNTLSNTNLVRTWPLVQHLIVRVVILQTQRNGKLLPCLMNHPLRQIEVLICKSWFHPTLVEHWQQTSQISCLKLENCSSVNTPLRISRSLLFFACVGLFVPLIFTEDGIRLKQMVLEIALVEFVKHMPNLATWCARASSVKLVLSHNNDLIGEEAPMNALYICLASLSAFPSVVELNLHYNQFVELKFLHELSRVFPSLRVLRIQTNRPRKCDVDASVFKFWLYLQELEIRFRSDYLLLSRPE